LSESFQVGQAIGKLQGEVDHLKKMVASLTAKAGCRCSPHGKSARRPLTGWYCNLPYTCVSGATGTAEGSGSTQDEAYNNAYSDAVYACYDDDGLDSTGDASYEPINVKAGGKPKVSPTEKQSGEVCSLVPDSGPLATAPCTENAARKVTLNGICYCQVCCGGQWLYVRRSNGTFVKCGDGNQLYECNGNYFILTCPR